MSAGPDPASTEALERLLREGVPLTGALDARIVSASPDEVVVAAPLAPNINLHGTVFGGSASALALLAGWSLVHVALAAQGIHAPIVVRSGSVSFRAPLTGDFEATARFDAPIDWQACRERLASGRGARLGTVVTLSSGGRDCAHFDGIYVAIPE